MFYCYTTLYRLSTLSFFFWGGGNNLFPEGGAYHVNVDVVSSVFDLEKLRADTKRNYSVVILQNEKLFAIVLTCHQIVIKLSSKDHYYLPLSCPNSKVFTVKFRRHGTPDL